MVDPPLLNLELIILIGGVSIMHHAFENRFYQCTLKHCFPKEILVRWLCRDGFHHHYCDHWTLIQQSFPALSCHSHYMSFCPSRCFRGMLCDRYKTCGHTLWIIQPVSEVWLRQSEQGQRVKSHLRTTSHLACSSYRYSLLSLWRICYLK